MSAWEKVWIKAYRIPGKPASAGRRCPARGENTDEIAVGHAVFIDSLFRAPGWTEQVADNQLFELAP